MKRSLTILAAAFTLTVAAFGAETNSTADAEAKYTAVINERSQKIVDTLGISDTNMAVKIHAIIMAQYRALNAWHNENDAKLKEMKSDTNAVAQIHASLKKLHEQFLSRLAESLTPEQVEQVKDKMTYGKVQFTLNGYLIEYPGMNEAQQAEVLRLLKEAREEAMDGGSSEEKSFIFNRYKGKINIYLSKQGVHSSREKAKAKSAGTNAVGK